MDPLDNHRIGCKEHRIQLIMSSEELGLGKIELIEPTTGKLFFEHKTELIFCKPRLIPLKSQALERLEEMQRESAQHSQIKRLKSTLKIKETP